MELLKNITLYTAVLLTGLSAGFFYTWQVSVIQGTKLITDKSYLETMQSINRAILNPWFFIIFMGSLLVLLSASYMQYRSGNAISLALIIIATLTYLIGTIGVTALGNVPMNDALDKVNLANLDSYAMQKVRQGYELRWNQLHTIRTIFSVVAFALSLLVSFIKPTTIQ